MSLFGSLKNRLHRKKEDIYDYRSHILSEPQAMDEEPPMPDPLEPLPTRSSFQEQDFPPIVPRSRLKDLTVEPYSQERPAQPEEKLGRDYDIMDRLSIIEAQLAAIRSQTETINERLKNMELRTGARRY